ncbi:MAG: peptidoglycan-binding protein [Oscillospiraceae bacterium]
MSTLTYTDKEKKDHITELQRYLRTISFYNGAVPRIIPDGVYGIETGNAVKAFQKEYGLPVTGNVDENTWNRLTNEYITALEYISEPIGIQPFPNDGDTLSVGSSGAAVIMLQAMLSELSSSFANISPTDITGHFNKANESTVKFMQTVWGMTPSGKVDIFMWNRIVDLFNNEVLN